MIWSAANIIRIGQRCFSTTCKTAHQLSMLGTRLARHSSIGDVFLLRGDIGVGKTCFARGFIRALMKDRNLFVTSPTYLLDNTYHVEETDIIIHHLDLYRLKPSSDMSILGIPEIFSSCIVLIEWPERLSTLPEKYIDVHITSGHDYVPDQKPSKIKKDRVVHVCPVGPEEFKKRIDSAFTTTRTKSL